MDATSAAQQATTAITMIDALRTDFKRFSAAFLADLDRAADALAPKGVDAKTDEGYGDPADPRNKDGLKLTPRGIEVAYRMLEAGKNRYQIAKEMQITFGGATYRQSAWIKEGGVARKRIAIEP
jgi:DNA-binding NarL/FixJ family response regulator